MQHTLWWGTVQVPEKNSFLLNRATFILAVKHKAKEWCIQVNSMYEAIKNAFDVENIEIPFPHLSLYARNNTEPFPIQITKNKT